MRQSGATPTGLHSKVNILTKTVRKTSKATHLRDLVAGDSGFTLLETLAVMVIIGLLAAITVPQIAKWREKAYITSLKTDARNIANAVEAFYVDDQSYPTRPEYTALVGGADVKLNTGNTAVATEYWIATNSNAFSFIVRSSKTTSVVAYRSNESPTITVTP